MVQLQGMLLQWLALNQLACVWGVWGQQSQVPFKIGVGVKNDSNFVGACGPAEIAFIEEKFAIYTVQLGRLFFRDETLALDGNFTQLDASYFDRRAFDDYTTFEKQKFDGKPRVAVQLGNPLPTGAPSEAPSGSVMPTEYLLTMPVEVPADPPASPSPAPGESAPAAPPVRPFEEIDGDIMINVHSDIPGTAAAVDETTTAAASPFAAPCQSMGERCVAMDFEEFPGGTPVAAGQYVSDEWRAGYGVTLSVQPSGGDPAFAPVKYGTLLRQARILDSSDPPGGGTGSDLGSPNEDCGGPGTGLGGGPGQLGENCHRLGNVLIIQDANTPAAAVHEPGGNVTLDFDVPVLLYSISFLDLDEADSDVYVEVHRRRNGTDANDGAMISTTTQVYRDIPKLGKNAFQEFVLDASDVIKAVIVLDMEGAAIAGFDFCVPECQDDAAGERQLLTSVSREQPRQEEEEEEEGQLLQDEEDEAEEDEYVGLFNSRVGLDASVGSVEELVDLERKRRKLPVSYTSGSRGFLYKYGGLNTWTCEMCFGEYTDGRRQLDQEEELEQVSPLARALQALSSDQTDRQFLISALESVMSFGLTVDLSWNWKEWLRENGYDLGCLGDGHNLAVVFELIY